MTLTDEEAKCKISDDAQEPLKKKAKTDTIPISNTKFKNKFLKKHSSLLHYATTTESIQSPNGIIVN